MPHQVHLRTLGRTSAHRLSMLRNLAVSVLRYERVRTTEAKAKEVRRFVDKVVNLGRDGSLRARRRALALTRDPLIVEKVFTDLRPRFAERPSGFTRLVRLGHRVGDGAPLALIELLEGAPEPVKTAAPTPEAAAEPTPAGGVRRIAQRLRGRRAEEKPAEKAAAPAKAERAAKTKEEGARTEKPAKVRETAKAKDAKPKAAAARAKRPAGKPARAAGRNEGAEARGSRKTDSKSRKKG